jgi:hypothetical protein
MLRFFKSFFSKPRPPENTAPYKIDPPAPLTPPIVNMSVFPHLTVDGHGDVQEAKKPVAKTAAKPPAKAPAGKPRAPAPKTPAVKKPSPRKPRAK